MRVFVRVVLLIALLSLTVAAQTVVYPPDTFQLGLQTVNIPPPEGFVGTFRRFIRLREQTLSGSSDVTVLELYVPLTSVSDLEKNENTELPFFSRVAVGAPDRGREATAEEFRTLISELEKQQNALLDVNGPVFREAVAQAREALDKQSQSRSGLQAGQPKNLGYFQRETSVYSTMVLVPIAAFGQRRTRLGSLTFIHINDRIIGLQFYRNFTDQADVAILRDAVKRWTAAILAANK